MEIYAAIVGACAPTLVPAYRRLRYGDTTSRYTGDSQSSSRMVSVKKALFIHSDVGRPLSGPYSNMNSGKDIELSSMRRQYGEVYPISGGGCNLYHTTPDERGHWVPLHTIRVPRGILVKQDVSWLRLSGSDSSTLPEQTTDHDHPGHPRRGNEGRSMFYERLRSRFNI